MRLGSRVAALVLVLTLVLPGVALAHVTITPEQAPAGDTQLFTAYVPTEKDIPTTRVSLDVPDGFEVVDVKSPPGGWQGSVEDGAVVWVGGEIGTAGPEITGPDGQEIQTGESEEFEFTARAPDDPGEYVWAATQEYEDGSVVEWSGAGDSENPAPHVQVIASGPESTTAAGGGHEHGAGEGDHDHGAGGQNQETPAESADGGRPLSAYLMAGAGILVASAVVGGLVLMRGRG